MGVTFLRRTAPLGERFGERGGGGFGKVLHMPQRKNSGERVAEVRKLGEQLEEARKRFEVAREGRREGEKIDAAGEMSEIGGKLVRIASGTGNVKVGVAAVRALSGSTKLMGVAINCKREEVGIAAVRALRPYGQGPMVATEIHEDIAEEAGNVKVAVEAVKGIGGEKPVLWEEGVLGSIAKHRMMRTEVRLAAVERLSGNASQLWEIACCFEEEVAMAAAMALVEAMEGKGGMAIQNTLERVRDNSQCHAVSSFMGRELEKMREPARLRPGEGLQE